MKSSASPIAAAVLLNRACFCSSFIKYRHIRNCYACDPAYGQGVAKALGMTVADAQAARETDPAKGLPSFL